MFDLIICTPYRGLLEAALAQLDLKHLLAPHARDPLLEIESAQGWMGYLRAAAPEVERLGNIAQVEILAIAPFVGEGTADALYHRLFADAEARKRYERLYPPALREASGSRWFGVMQGA